MMMRPDNLLPHPEGGRFQEVYRSTSRLTAADRGERAALTHIYFELAPGEVSRFHRVASDEVWNLYRGAGVRLHLWDADAATVRHVDLSAAGNTFCHVIPAGVWQAAEPIDGPVLVGCTVAPGFEFADFDLLQAEMPEVSALLSAEPEMRRFLGL